MTTYIVKELQNSGSFREGTAIEAASLTDAKRKASGLQTFQGTTLRIENESGEVLACKEDGKWMKSWN